MRFGGIQKSSGIDYPGRLSCVLFTQGCNLRCPYCHNPELAGPGTAETMPWNEQDFVRFLAGRRGLLDGVAFSGGEPTLQPDLAAWCRIVKSEGFRVKLDTNGSRPEVLRFLLTEGLVDYVAMDIKTVPGAYVPHFAAALDPGRIEASIDLVRERAAEYEFRTTCAQPLVGEGEVLAIARRIRGARRYVLQRFHKHKLLDPGFFTAHPDQYTEEDLHRLAAGVNGFVEEVLVR